MSIGAILSLVWAVLTLPAALYLGVLTLGSRRKASPESLHPPPMGTRFVVVIPAYNEEGHIVDTIRSLQAVDYPEALRHTVVVADNCTDATALRAQEAGAEVWERTDANLRGKGYALDYAFERILSLDAWDAVVVVDADSLVSANVLREFEACLQAGAQVVQADYDVRNPHASWRTCLMAVALAMFHQLRSLARQRWGVSVGLRGNGMCFACGILRTHPHRAYSLVEDVEYGMTLGLSGIRVAYADKAKIWGEMASHASASASQRQRWEGGRRQLVRRMLPALLKQTIRYKSGMRLDLIMDLLTPPLSSIALCVALGWVFEGLLRWTSGSWGISGALWGFHTLCLTGYVARGVVLSGLGWQAVRALLWAPVYMVWKTWVRFRPGRHSGRHPGRHNVTWVRTAREPQVSPQGSGQGSGR